MQPGSHSREEPRSDRRKKTSLVLSVLREIRPKPLVDVFQGILSFPHSLYSAFHIFKSVVKWPSVLEAPFRFGQLAYVLVEKAQVVQQLCQSDVSARNIAQLFVTAKGHPTAELSVHPKAKWNGLANVCSIIIAMATSEKMFRCLQKKTENSSHEV